MKSRDLGVYVAAGMLAGTVLAWSATRVARTAAPPSASTATSALLSPPAQSLESFPRISQEDFSKRMERGEIVVIDVRDAGDYTNAHIPGAMHIPLSFIQGELPYLPRGKPIVTYCSCPAEESSGRAAIIIRSAGLDASALLGGFSSWQGAGLPVHEGREP